MKKIILILALALTTSAAYAWHNNCHEGIVYLAVDHLTPKAKNIVEKHLGKSYNDDIKYLYNLEKAKQASHSKEIHYLHLAKNFKPKAKKGDKNDAYNAINNSLEIIKAYNKYPEQKVTEALRTLINLMCDIHDLAHIRIKGYPHSYEDFTYLVPKSESGKGAKKMTKAKWSTSWSRWGNYPAGFSGQYRAYDMTLCLDGRFDEFTKGNILNWIADNGAIAAYYLNMCTPDAVVPYMEQKKMDDVNYDMMIKAGCRLAKLLNETLK